METSTNQLDTLDNINSIIEREPSTMPTYLEAEETSTTNTQIPPHETGMQLALGHYNILVEFTQKVLQRGVDYGVIPNTSKPTLLKAGAEKLCQLFQLSPKFERLEVVTDWTGAAHGLSEPLFHYHYKCSLFRGEHLIAEGEGCCNSLERKYRYTKDGKPNPRIYDAVNTICKMAQKRSLVAAVLIATGASEFFTQDLEDMAERVSQESEPKNGELDRANLEEQSSAIMQKLGWSKITASAFAEKVTGKKSRKDMSTKELHLLVGVMLQELEKINQQKAS
ncbi:hypothetical protein [Floridanema evergladense]|uniref:Uncharacterized protein n=1 Tax=Floridaenema evergladense BLCC-F167 TaxID=3153639 RepID=A0ABV4WUW8_9CYAN